MNTRLAFSTIQKKDRTHGFFFDLGLTAGNFMFLWLLSDAPQALPDKTIGILLLAAVGAQGTGAVLKRGPLAARLGAAGSDARQGCASSFMQLLLFLHFLLFTVLTLLGLALVEIVDLSGSSTTIGESAGVLAALFVGAVATYLVWRAGNPAAGERHPPRAAHPLQEVGADLLLGLSVLIITRLIWEGLFVDLTTMRGIGMSGRSIVLLVSLSILFIVFYIPSRYLFLVEDYHYPGTWLQVWLPMLPVAWSILVG